MGLKIHSLAEIPESVSRKFYLHILDYYNWDEPIINTLKDNFDRIAEFASENDAVVIQGIGDSHFYSDLLSFDSINGKKPEDMLPALMITTVHPSYFADRNDKRCDGEPVPEDEIVFIKLHDTCKQPADVLNLLSQIFDDIKSGRELKNFQIAEQQKRGQQDAIVDSLILEPNFGGVGVDLKKLWSSLRG